MGSGKLLPPPAKFAITLGLCARVFGLAIAVVLPLIPSASLAQSGGMTAEELLQNGSMSYNAGDWAKAEQAFQSFLTDFGSSPQAAEAVPRVKPLLALSQVRLKKFTEAEATIQESLAIRTLSPAQKEELTFWYGVCLMQSQKYDLARKTLDQYAAEFPNSPRRSEAWLLSGTAFVVEEKLTEAAAYFSALNKQLTGTERGRGVLLLLYCLVQSDQLDDALALVVTESKRLHEVVQLAAFQTMTLELGSKLLEKEEHRKAIAALQRVWIRDRVLKHQEGRLTILQERLAALELQRADAQYTFQTTQLIAKIERELKTFREIKNFDSALRLRLASAFQGMQRYREAALCMEGMLRELPADPIVEQASVNVLQCWSEIERWPKVVDCATEFTTKFPTSKYLPTVLFLKGNAEQSDLQYKESIATFDGLAKKYPKDPLAARAFFMKGFGQLLMEDYAAALKTFEEFPSRYGTDPLGESVAYWRGMAYSLAKQHEKSREIMAEYLTRYPDGKYRGEATFRRAYCAQSLKDYATSIQELQEYLERYPGHANSDEALVLLGDALMNEGEVERGMAAYKRISPESVRFFEEGWFKVGKALRQMEEFPQLRSHMSEFRDRFPGSPRVAEAIYWMGWVDREQGSPEKAREIYWTAIREWGNDPNIKTVEDLFPALGKLYKGDEERAAYRQLIKDLREEATAREETLLMFRTLWAEANLIKRKDPLPAAELLEEASKLAKVETSSPMVLADIADSLRSQGALTDSEKIYLGLLKWNPRAPQRDRALAGLGYINLAHGYEKAALDYFKRFEEETLGSMMLGDVLIQQAELLTKRGEKEAAKATLEKLLGVKTAGGKSKAEALYRIGELMMAEGKPELAIPYFQKIYITYGRWTDFVAKAYLKSGEAFEKLNNTDAAVKSYQELTAREDLAEFAETAAAKKRLDQLVPAEGNS